MQYCLKGLSSQEPAFCHSDCQQMFQCCGSFPDFFPLHCFRLLHPKNIFLKGRFGSVVPSNDSIKALHWQGPATKDTLSLLLKNSALDTELMCISRGQPMVTDKDWNQDRREQLRSLISPVHKSLTSLSCVNQLRCQLQFLVIKNGEKKIFIVTNPSSPSPCNVPKPQSLCGDDSKFPTLISEPCYEHSDQANSSCLLPKLALPAHCSIASNYFSSRDKVQGLQSFWL